MGATHVGPLGYGDFSRRQFRQMTTKTGQIFLQIKELLLSAHTSNQGGIEKGPLALLIYLCLAPTPPRT